MGAGGRRAFLNMFVGVRKEIRGDLWGKLRTCPRFPSRKKVLNSNWKVQSMERLRLKEKKNWAGSQLLRGASMGEMCLTHLRGAASQPCNYPEGVLG